MSCEPATADAGAGSRVWMAALVALWATALGALEVPYLAGRVNDLADLVPPEVEARLAEKLAAFEEETGAQIAVLTIPGLEGEVLEEYSLRVAETWGLGREGKDDGVLLLVARDDRKMRIEVGYGLEGALTDLQSGRILRNILRPAFREGEFGSGIEEGVDAIVATLSGEDVIPDDEPRGAVSGLSLPARIVGLLLFLGFISLFMASALFQSGCSSWFLYLILIPFVGGFPAAMVHPSVGVTLAVLWIVGFPILKWIVAKTGLGERLRTRYPTVARGGSSSWSGGGFSSGGFSGGGGSFGGGGASSSW